MGGAAQDLLLAFDKLGEILGPRAPFGVGIAPPSAGTETRHVDKDPVEAAGMALDPFVPFAGQRAALDIADPGAAQPARRAFEAAERNLAGDQLAPIGHPGGQCQSLAARPGAEIDDPHPRLCISEEGGDLRAFILHFDKTLLERG